MNPAFCQDWVDELRREVEAERMKPRTYLFSLNERKSVSTKLWQSD